jgi:hypothetical protein
MTQSCLAGRYAGRRTTLVNWRSLKLSVPLIEGFLFFCHIVERDRFEYLKRSFSIVDIMVSGETCPQGNSYNRTANYRSDCSQ